MTATPDPAGRGAAAAPCASITVPASTEAADIEACRGALLAQQGVAGGQHIIVVANGCHDATAALARAFEGRLAARGWQLSMIERARSRKIAALNAGDARATAGVRIHLGACRDAGRIAGLLVALARNAPPQNPVTRATAGVRLRLRLPFVAQGATGAEPFAVNAAGRTRAGLFPDVIPDDAFVRVHFRPEERHEIASGYRWPMVAGLRALVGVRRRDAGVRRIAQRHPARMENAAKAPPGARTLPGLAMRATVEVAVDMRTWALCHIGPSDGQWTCGR
ncbi:glycosyl transferase [Rhodobaculum claviforme]|uniref:Uncharacterized protein n=1 Tax=Rhodobaculum claviforme TaxID=1549854 RepID=A0A934WKE4_9RHOB|nr:glycosyl transferase [Rhodobaculum claviforme]MBK5928468.1 hypothetical protein [Rhodobaculum claviforme]